MQAKLANTVHAAQAAAIAELGRAAALEVMLVKTGSNPVAQVLQHLGDFYEWRDYPEGGVWDHASGFGYFYHAHPGSAFTGEHGHFHLFWASARDSRRNLLALSMDGYGRVLGAFAANQWHTELAAGDDAASLYAQFRIDLAYPCYAANQWLGSVVRGLATPLVRLHQRGLAALADPAVAQDRGRAVVASERFDLAARAQAPQRPSLKPVKR